MKWINMFWFTIWDAIFFRGKFVRINSCFYVCTYLPKWAQKRAFWVFGKFWKICSCSMRLEAFLIIFVKVCQNQWLSGIFCMELWPGVAIHVQTCLSLSLILLNWLRLWPRLRNQKFFLNLPYINDHPNDSVCKIAI